MAATAEGGVNAVSKGPSGAAAGMEPADTSKGRGSSGRSSEFDMPTVTTVPVPAEAVVLDPTASELSLACFRLTGADPVRIETTGSVEQAIRNVESILSSAHLPGRAVTMIEMAASGQSGAGGPTLDVRVGVGIAGGDGQTADECRERARYAAQALRRWPAPLEFDGGDASALLGRAHDHAMRIRQSTSIIVGDDDRERSVVRRFSRPQSSWLELANMLIGRETETAIRFCFLATDVGSDLEAYLTTVAEVARLRADSARQDPLNERYADRVVRTAIDTKEALTDQAWIGDVLILSSAPISEVFAHAVASALSPEDAGEGVGFAPAVSFPLSGGYELDWTPPHVAEAVQAGLPTSAFGAPEMPDLYSLRNRSLPFQLPLPVGGSIPTVPINVAHPLAAPADVPESGVLLGKDPKGRAIFIDDDARTRHLHALGVTGSGKSTLQAAMIRDDIQRGRMFLLLDPHQDLATRARAAALEAERAVVVLDPSESGTGSLQLFEGVGTNGVTDQDRLERSIGRIVEAITSHLPPEYSGPRFTQTARAALMVVAYGGEGRHLGDVPRLLMDKEFAAGLLETYEGPEWVKDHMANYAEDRSSEKNTMADWVAAKFRDFVGNEAIKRMLAPIGAGITMAEAIRANTPVIASAEIGTLSRLDSRLFGHLVLAAVIDAALERGAGDRELMSIYVDEIHTFPVGNLERGLVEARKFGVGFVLAHQHLSQLPTSMADALVGGVATRAMFRLSPSDSAFIGPQLGLPSRDLTGQPDLHAFLSMSRGGRALPVFSLLLDSPGPVPNVPELVAAPPAERPDLPAKKKAATAGKNAGGGPSIGPSSMERSLKALGYKYSVTGPSACAAVWSRSGTPESIRLVFDVQKPRSDGSRRLVVQGRTPLVLARNELAGAATIVNRFNQDYYEPTVSVHFDEDTGQGEVVCVMTVNVPDNTPESVCEELARRAVPAMHSFWTYWEEHFEAEVRPSDGPVALQG